MSSLMTLLAVLVNGIVPSIIARSDGVEVRLLRVTESRFANLAEPTSKDGNPMMFTSFGPENALTITMELKGDRLSTATHYGQVTLEARDNKGQPITLHESYKSGLTDLQSEMAQIDHNMMFFAQADPPDDVLRIDLKCNAPSRDVESISVSNGTVKIRTGNPHEVMIPGIMNLVGKKISDPLLSQAGLQIIMNDPKEGNNYFFSGEPGKSITLTFSGELDSLLSMDLVDINGEDINESKMWSAMGSNTRYTLMADDSIPADAQLKIKVTTNNQVIEVPFSFRKVTLP
ncbi:MAG: hypothetical protein ACYTHJ_10845 [Planctomycetota bacterium]|jgi:hypothetical protein